jgi:hypothetical protein
MGGKKNPSKIRLFFVEINLFSALQSRRKKCAENKAYFLYLEPKIAYFL